MIAQRNALAMVASALLFSLLAPAFLVQCKSTGSHGAAGSGTDGGCLGAGEQVSGDATGCCSGLVVMAPSGHRIYDCDCSGPDKPCHASSDCCHGECSAGKCVCSASGAACEVSSDCCSGSCVGGQCGCAAVGTVCGHLTGPADCCTLHCFTADPPYAPPTCTDPIGTVCDAGSDCAPGEACEAGRCCLALGQTNPSYPTNCCTGYTSATGVCCLPGHAVCKSSGDCCSGDCAMGHCACGKPGTLCNDSDLCCTYCSGGKCACLEGGQACLAATDCCSGSCTSGKCACGATGIVCVYDTDCCAGACANGACACAAPGATCDDDALCCSQKCVGNACM